MGILCLLCYGLLCTATAADDPISGIPAAKVKMAAGAAEITHLTGEAALISEKGRLLKSVAAGERLPAGSRVRTGKGARMELKLPDGSFIRFDEETTFQLESAVMHRREKKRNISIRMVLGKVWAKVSRLFANRGRFAISTKTAVAGVRGTVYRMNVNKDDSAVVKVYYGQVLVSKREMAENTKAFQRLEEPKAVSGPHPIPGPHPVSAEKWEHLVGSLQQIVIRPDGTATKPFRFSIEADTDDWVRWNKARDESVK